MNKCRHYYWTEIASTRLWMSRPGWNIPRLSRINKEKSDCNAKVTFRNMNRVLAFLQLLAPSIMSYV